MVWSLEFHGDEDVVDFWGDLAIQILQLFELAWFKSVGFNKVIKVP
jgi:hypothetical protein